MTISRRLLGVFSTPDEATEAVVALRDDDRCRLDVYCPVPDHHLLDAVPPKRKWVRGFSLIGGLLGLAGGFALAFWTASLYELFLSGMEWDAVVPFVIIGFEVTVLFGGLATMLGLLVGMRLPKFWDPPLWDARLSEDHYGVGLDCAEDDVDALAAILERHGAEDVHRAE